jgi:hypothetical protein
VQDETSTKIIDDTLAYESWLRTNVNVVEADLRLKHEQMAKSVFAFLRATFYSWACQWPKVCAELNDVPRVLAVGDLHIENFGTWRDAEGRMIWGVNDFDEAARMPYTIDLVRLVTSAILAKKEDGLSIEAKDAASAVLDGYGEAMESGGNPFVLEEYHPTLRSLAMSAEREPVRFWSKLTKLPRIIPPESLVRLLRRSLPKGSQELVFYHRVAGVGSLGRPRYVVIASCNGGFVAREAKAWLPSAWGWGKGRPKDRAASTKLLSDAVRQRDPYYGVKDGWVTRRLAPHCGRIELTKLSNESEERHLLRAMGHEAANLHLASGNRRKQVLRDLKGQKPAWLLHAAQAMAAVTEEAQAAFRAWHETHAT